MWPRPTNANQLLMLTVKPRVQFVSNLLSIGFHLCTLFEIYLVTIFHFCQIVSRPKRPRQPKWMSISLCVNANIIVSKWHTDNCDTFNKHFENDFFKRNVIAILSDEKNGFIFYLVVN